MSRWVDAYCLNQRVEVYTGIEWRPGRIAEFTKQGFPKTIIDGCQGELVIVSSRKDEIRLAPKADDLKGQPPAEATLDIEDIPPLIDGLRQKLLCNHDGSYLDPEAEQFYLLALESLGQAQRFAELAALKQRRALAAHQGMR